MALRGTFLSGAALKASAPADAAPAAAPRTPSRLAVSCSGAREPEALNSAALASSTSSNPMVGAVQRRREVLEAEYVEEELDGKLREECGVVGIWGDDEAARLTFLCLHALQHRGQEGAGIVTCDDNGKMHTLTGMGLVSEVFQKGKLSELVGSCAIGHVRYSTSGSSMLKNVQVCPWRALGATPGIPHCAPPAREAPVPPFAVVLPPGASDRGRGKLPRGKTRAALELQPKEKEGGRAESGKRRAERKDLEGVGFAMLATLTGAVCNARGSYRAVLALFLT